jgi:hypothetical protein
MSRLVLSCSTKFFKIQVNLAKKIQVKVYANQDKSLANLKILATLMISTVFCSLIIHDFDKYFYYKYMPKYCAFRFLVLPQMKCP